MTPGCENHPLYNIWIQQQSWNMVTKISTYIHTYTNFKDCNKSNGDNIKKLQNEKCIKLRLVNIISGLEAGGDNKIHISLLSSSSSNVCLPQVVVLKTHGCDLEEERDGFKRNCSFTYFKSFTNWTERVTKWNKFQHSSLRNNAYRLRTKYSCRVSLADR